MASAGVSNRYFSLQPNEDPQKMPLREKVIKIYESILQVSSARMIANLKGDNINVLMITTHCAVWHFNLNMVSLIDHTLSNTLSQSSSLLLSVFDI